MVRGLLLLALIPALALAAPATRTFDVRHRSADDMAATLKPLLPAEASLAVAGNTLIIRADEAALAEIAPLVARLDVAVRTVRITVRQVGGNEGIREEARRDGSRVRIYGTRDADAPTLVQSVQVSEGQWARVDMGRAHPVVTQSSSVGPQGTTVEHRTEYKNVTSGFEVLPRLSGDEVTVEVRAYRGDRARDDGGAFETRSVEATVTGRLGQWITLGGQGDVAESGRDTIHSTRSRDSGEYTVQLKVEPVP